MRWPFGTPALYQRLDLSKLQANLGVRANRPECRYESHKLGSEVQLLGSASNAWIFENSFTSLILQKPKLLSASSVASRKLKIRHAFMGGIMIW